MSRELRRAGPIPGGVDGKLRQCPVCRVWINCKRGRQKLENHIEREPDEAHQQAWTKVYLPFIKDRALARRQYERENA